MFHAIRIMKSMMLAQKLPAVMSQMMLQTNQALKAEGIVFLNPQRRHQGSHFGSTPSHEFCTWLTTDFLMCLSAAEELEHSTRVKESIQGGIQAFAGGVSSQGSLSFSPELCEPLQFHTCMAMHLAVETQSGAQSLCKFHLKIISVEFCMCSSSAIQ